MRRALAGLAVGGALWPFLEPHLPVLRRVEVPVLPAGAAPRAVLHLSDLHLLPRHRRRAAWVRRLARLEPDLVVSTGDHLSALEALPLLTGIARAFACPGAFVPGNNDYFLPRRPHLTGYLRGGGPPRMRRSDLPWDQVAAGLGGAGWTELTGRRVELAGLLLTGTDDARLGRDRDGGHGPVPAGAVGVGVTHTPQSRVLRRLAADGNALVLAGHTHGGQLRVPGLGPLLTNCDLPRDRARGLTRDGGAWLHVSAGLGTSPYLPARVCCRPEATLLTLVPAAPRPGAGVR